VLLRAGEVNGIVAKPVLDRSKAEVTVSSLRFIAEHASFGTRSVQVEKRKIPNRPSHSVMVCLQDVRLNLKPFGLSSAFKQGEILGD
jgi:hypothetical protein